MLHSCGVQIECKEFVGSISFAIYIVSVMFFLGFNLCSLYVVFTFVTQKTVFPI